MAIAIVMPDRRADAERLRDNLNRLDDSVRVWIWPEVTAPDAVTTVVSWNHPAGALAEFPGLGTVLSYGAGVEHLLADPALPAGVAVARTVDESLARDMAEFVAGRIVEHRREFVRYREDQRQGRWRPRAYPSSCTVLVLGAGRLGSAVCAVLAALGHEVVAWSRSGRPAPGAVSCRGEDALKRELPRADVVVCVLPLTEATRGLLDRDFLARMRPGALLVNVGRGAHVVEADLLAALDEGRPGCAALDVFAEEPLPPKHPFWRHPGVTLSPHVASLTNAEAVAAIILDNHRRTVEGRPLVDRVDPDRGY